MKSLMITDFFPVLTKGLWEIGARWWSHKHSRSSAALAFYSLFSMIPILLVVTQAATAVIGHERALHGVRKGVGFFFDDKTSIYLESLMSAQPTHVFAGVSSIIGFIVLLSTASKVVVELRGVLTVVFGEKTRDGRRGFIIDMILSQVIPILLVFAAGAVLAVWAIASAALKMMSAHLGEYVPYSFQLWEWAQRLVPLIASSVLFAMILRWLPSRPPVMIDAFAGACVACLLLAVLRSGISIYFGHSSVITTYGAAVTLVVVLLWIYFTIQIFFFGAETSAYLDRLRQKRNDVVTFEGFDPDI